jgi:flavorubredoxin
MMTFTYVPFYKVLVEFKFSEHILFDQDHFGQHFCQDALPLLDDKGGWIGVLCFPEEWDAYTNELLKEFRAVKQYNAYLAVNQDKLAFLNWWLALQKTPLYPRAGTD